MVCRLGSSIVFFQLFNLVSDLNSGTNLRDSYILAILAGLLILFSLIVRDNGSF
jgi:hypothetical protein